MKPLDFPGLLIIADDLSGAADCAADFASRIDTHVLLTGSARDLSGVIAIDADSRRLPPQQAADRNRAALQQQNLPGMALYKKIDSTLRGNVASEVDALLGLRGMALVAPAFPAMKRTTEQGVQLLDGVPVDQSDVWRNEHLHGTSNLLDMFTAQGLRTQGLGVDTVRDPVALKSALRAALAQKVQALVCDAQLDSDLQRLAAATAEWHDELFWVGSAGLAHHLPQALGLAAARALEITPRTPVLTVVGSMSGHSQAQADQLAQAALPFCLTLQPKTLLDPGSADERSRLRLQLDAQLTAGHDVLVRLDQQQRDPAQAALLSNALADWLAPTLDNAGSLIATGGETARAILVAAGITHMTLRGELATGVVLSEARLHAHTLNVVTKAGGFGEPDTLLAAWRHLHATAPTGTLSQRKHPMSERPVIGITMGDAAGVGPEIIMKALTHASVYANCRPLVIGDAKRLEDANRIVGGQLRVNSIARPSEARFIQGTVDCIDLGLIPDDLPYGKLSAIAGNAAFRYIERTVQLTEAGELDAICTAPLNKEALHAGGHIFPGHTEMLAHLLGVEEVSMMLMTPTLRVIHVTTHIGIIDAIARIEPGLVKRTLERARETLIRAGIENPLIAVCGINPHAGENGLFGYGEEATKIQPAIDELLARGWRVEGPLPADTLFFRAGRGDFDAVVAMYHDQGHGPVKVMGLEAGVNVTIGLPVIRTSVDHGTAFDIAGKGIADERSLIEALRQGVELATRKRDTRNSIAV